MRLIIAGGRDFSDKVFAFEALNQIKEKHTIDLVLCGGCRGADFIGQSWALDWGIPIKYYRADWTLGPKAGPLRNQEMADNADACVLFPGGKGTEDMFNRGD